MQSFEQRMQDAVAKIERVGILYAEAKGVSWHMQEMRKVIHASEIQRLQAISKFSFGQTESDARNTLNYRQHLDGTREAIQNELKLKAQFEAAKAGWESLRSLCSLEKKQIEAFEHESQGEEQ